MIFFESFAAMGYSAWNVAVAFFFIGGLLAASIGLHRRARLWQGAYIAGLLGLFATTIIVLAPIVEETKRYNENWETRRETDEREIRRRQQFQPPAPPSSNSEPATPETPTATD